MVFVIEQPRENCRCARCGSAEVHSRGSHVRHFRCAPIGRKPVFLEYAVPRLYCWSCRAMLQPKLGFADPKKRYTRSFARYVLALSQLMTLQDVALHLGISWDTVKEIQRQHLQTHFAKPKLKHLRQIAIDEISIGETGRAVPFYSCYGSTESAPFATAVNWQGATGGMVGLPMPGVELKLAPVDGLTEARIKGPTVTPGYWRNPDATSKAFDEEGYYCFGDAMAPAGDDPSRGLVFDGRISENFKLATGTWVNVAGLRDRLLTAAKGALADVGSNRVALESVETTASDALTEMKEQLVAAHSARAAHVHSSVTEGQQRTDELIEVLEGVYQKSVDVSLQLCNQPGAPDEMVAEFIQELKNFRSLIMTVMECEDRSSQDDEVTRRLFRLVRERISRTRQRLEDRVFAREFACRRVASMR